MQPLPLTRGYNTLAEPIFRTSVASAAGSAAYDVGLRTHMQRVFNYMAGGLAITGGVAFLAAMPPLADLIFGTPFRWVAMLAPFVFLLWMNFKIESISAAKAQTLFWAFCGTMGLSLGSIFLVYTGGSIARAFFITSATFAAMSLWGYTTKRDLASFGAFLMMGMLGLFIASLVNIFMASDMLNWLVSIVGVFVFTGLTAYDVQNIKQSYAESWGPEANSKLAVMGALSLYMNFINAFMFLLRLIGDRR